MVSLFSRLSFAQGDIFSRVASDLNGSMGVVVKTAMMLVGFVYLVYAAFGLRKYLSGDGRGDKEFVKMLTGAVIAIVLITIGATVFTNV